MIAGDQPTIFPPTITVALSSLVDGSMKDGTELMTASAVDNRDAFLRHNGMEPSDAAVFYADFTTDDYCRYASAVPGLMPGYDGVSTAQPNQPLLLPLADCVGTVIYDPEHAAVMLAHLGRHSTEQMGGTKVVEYMVGTYGTIPAELLVWLGPSPNGTDYPLYTFDNRSFTEVLCQQLRDAGVQQEHIEICSVDTSTNPQYFSHSQYLKGTQGTDGRYAVAVQLL
jgi:copper oxidase (laccase) domain-containing protein